MYAGHYQACSCFEKAYMHPFNNYVLRERHPNCNDSKLTYFGASFKQNVRHFDLLLQVLITMRNQDL